MIQIDEFKRPSPSPSRCSVRSDSRVLRQPRVIRVNRDVATMMDDQADCTTRNVYEPEPILISDFEPEHTPQSSNFRSRTFSDGFTRNTSVELLLGVDCEACRALAAQSQCYSRHVSEHDLPCNCDMQRNSYVSCHRDVTKQRGHTLSIYDMERMKRNAGRNNLINGTHCSLDRKQIKSKNVANYISKQLISYDPTSSLVQKIKEKLSNLKRIGGEAMSRRSQNAVHLGESAGSGASLRKLSMLSLVDKTNGRRTNSHSCVYSSTSLQSNDFNENINTYANFSANVDQCFDRLRDRSSDLCKPKKISDLRTLNKNEGNVTRNSSSIKFSTLDNRSRCRGMRRQMSYSDFASARFSDATEARSPNDNTLGASNLRSNVLSENGQPFLEDERNMGNGHRVAHAQCTCDSGRTQKIPSIFPDSHGKKKAAPDPDVTSRVQDVSCSVCESAQRPPTAATSTASHSSSTTGSSRLSGWQRRWCCVAVLVLVAGSACVAGPLALRAPPGAPLPERLRLAKQLLHDTPLVDGHNDLPWNIRKFLHNRIKDFRFDEDLRTISPWATSSWSHTDLPRLKEGRVAAQFWAAYVPCHSQHKDAVQLTFEQIDVIQRLTDKYHPELTFCTSVSDILSAHVSQRVCSLVGVEGGHAIGGSLGVLRTLYQVGVRYLTLTSSCDTPWAECASTARPQPSLKGGLSPFGKVVIKEMNRLGMLVDLSHVSERTMRDALAASRAPVLFSHSSARSLCNVTRNVPDSVLRLLAANKGLVMVNFYTAFLTCGTSATVQDAIAHINHIRDVAGADCVGLGAGYDGINYTPQGLEDVSSYPLLFAELMEAGWNMEDLKKLAGLNLLRVFSAAERVSKELAASHVAPYEDVAPRTLESLNCSSQDL